MATYEVRTCDCGRIHFIDHNKFDGIVFNDRALNGKELLFVCRGCGAATRIGLEAYDSGYAYYSIPLESGDIYPLDDQVTFLSDGYRIPMHSGGYAISFRGGLWIDEESLVLEKGDGYLFDFKEVSYGFRPSLTIRDFPSLNVNMSRVLRELDGDHLRAISGFLWKSFDWSGTEYEREWNK